MSKNTENASNAESGKVQETTISKSSGKPERSRIRNVGRRDYPIISFDEATKIAEAVKKCGGRATPQLIGETLGESGTSGWFTVKIKSTKNWGLIDGHGELSLTDLAKKVFYPITPSDPENAKIEAFMSVDLFKRMFERFRESGFPEGSILKNVIFTENKMSEDDASKVASIILETVNTTGLEKLSSTKVEVPVENQVMPSASVPNTSAAPMRQQIPESILDETQLKAILAVGGLLSLSSNQKKSEQAKVLLEEITEAEQLLPTLNITSSAFLEMVKEDPDSLDLVLKQTKRLVKGVMKDLNIKEEDT